MHNCYFSGLLVRAQKSVMDQTVNTSKRPSKIRRIAHEETDRTGKKQHVILAHETRYRIGAASQFESVVWHPLKIVWCRAPSRSSESSRERI
ncbi:protein of unknown function [Caballeronia sp. S22]